MSIQASSPYHAARGPAPVAGEGSWKKGPGRWSALMGRGLRGAAWAVAAGLGFVPSAYPAAGTESPPPLDERVRTFAVDRAGTARPGLPLSFGVAVDPADPLARFELRRAGEAIDAGFTTLGEHPDGRPGFVLVEARDPGRGPLDLVELPADAPRGSAARRATWEPVDDDDGVAAAPRWVLELEGAYGARIVCEPRPRAVLERPGGTRVVRHGGAFVLDDDHPLLRVDVYETHFPFTAEYGVLEIVVRNDSLEDAHGPVRFEGLRLRPRGAPAERLAVAWASSEQARSGRDTRGPYLDLFAETDPEGRWLGDWQGKAWRGLWGRASLEGGAWESALRWLERPTALIPDPREAAATGWYGPIEAHAPGFTPDASFSERAASRLSWSWTDGWSGARGDTRYSGSTGSARLGLHGEASLRWVQSGHRAFVDWLVPTAYAQALRPFPREFDAALHPDVWLWDGRPRARSGADLLGRDDPVELPREWRLERELTWLDEWHGWNGFDTDHLTLDLVRDLYLLTGSPWAERELRAMGEALATHDAFRTGSALGNSRAIGWQLRALAQLDGVLGGERWLAGAERIVRGASDRAQVHRGLTWLTILDADPRGLADSAFEYPWHLAIACYGLDAFLRRRPESGGEVAAELLDRLCATLAEGCFDPDEQLFAYAVSPHDPEGRRTSGPRGTTEWIPSAVVLGWARRDDDSAAPWMARVRAHAAALAPGPSYRASGGTWSYWQPFVVVRSIGFGRESAARALGVGGRGE